MQLQGQEMMFILRTVRSEVDASTSQGQLPGGNVAWRQCSVQQFRFMAEALVQEHHMQEQQLVKVPILQTNKDKNLCKYKNGHSNMRLP